MASTDTASTELQAIKADLATLRDDMSSLSKTLMRDGRKKARAARDAVEKGLADAGESVEEFVEERPYATMAISFSAGALLAILLCRRS